MDFACRIRLSNGSPVVSSHADADEAIAFAVRWLRSEEAELDPRYPPTSLIEVVDEDSEVVVWRWQDGIIEDFREQSAEPHG